MKFLRIFQIWISIYKLHLNLRPVFLDAPGTLHHVMGRGIERTRIFRNDSDREDFLSRLADLCREGAWVVSAFDAHGGPPAISEGEEASYMKNEREVCAKIG